MNDENGVNDDIWQEVETNVTGLTIRDGASGTCNV